MTHEIQQFNELLESRFDGRLRARWSTQRQEVQIEQKVARGLSNFPVPHDDSDDAVRTKDGYFYIMSIRNGTKMPCPKCNTELQVPVRQIRELSCPRCKARGLEHRVSAGFYPMDESLIEYLTMIDPLRGASKELRNKINKHNEEFMAGQRKKVLNDMSDAAGDDFSRIAGIPSVGYTGKEFQKSEN